ncbi:putative hsp70-interacting protein isoform 1 [Schistosoma japonicum]|nr:hsp70-interacting protein [Schistosoma japonicum]KAH8871843.1 hsp70-interacting protein [Schistosoma japonicum]KAH8871844.1 hsp70-interacting protein [Schistosoma japonicum]TNN17493.1 putative hsp70-interacting protein isoform 1 [Schistosoma japonicum]
MAQNLQGLLRFAIEHSENAPTEPIDPKDAEWLREALSASTVDLSKQLTDDVHILSSHLSSTEPNLDEMKDIIEDLLTLTEDLDLSNNFLVVGQDVLLKLLFCGPPSLRADALRLLGNITQNNPKAQSLYTDNGVLARLIVLFEEETNVEFLRYLLLAISCITQTYMPGINVFMESNGVNLVLDALVRELRKDKSDKVLRLVSKGAFLVFCVMQELALKELPPESSNVADRLVHLLCLLDNPQEHLLATLTLLLCPKRSNSNCILNVQSEEQYKPFYNWLQRHSDELCKVNDPADEECREYISTLLKVLSSK